MHSRLAPRNSGILSVLAGALVFGGCARNKPGETESGPARIVFVNESLAQADLFAVSRGVGSRKLGTVFAGRTDTLTLPADLAMRGGLSLVARMLAGGTAGSGVLALRPGEWVNVRLPLDQRTLVVLPVN